MRRFLIVAVLGCVVGVLLIVMWLSFRPRDEIQRRNDDRMMVATLTDMVRSAEVNGKFPDEPLIEVPANATNQSRRRYFVPVFGKPWASINDADIVLIEMYEPKDEPIRRVGTKAGYVTLETTQQINDELLKRWPNEAARSHIPR